MLKNYKLFLEKVYNIDLTTNQATYEYIKGRGRLNRLKHLVYQLEKTGDPINGEKVSEILLGGVNLNVLDLSYPFVDLKVVTPVPGISNVNELISVKTTRDKHKLKDAVTYVNGFKIGQLIQFAISEIDLNLYKTKVFKKRNAIRLSSVTSFYDKLIKDLFGKNEKIYTFVFVHTLLFYYLLKEYLEILSTQEIIITDRNELYTNMAVLLCYYVDRKFNTNYLKNLNLKSSSDFIVEAEHNIINLFSKRIEEVVNAEDEEFGWLRFIPEAIRSLQISYCILFFDEDDEDSNKVVLNVCKTQSVSFEKLFVNTIKIWTQKPEGKAKAIQPMHLRSLERNKNIYLNYNGVTKAFEDGNLKGDDVFDTQIKIEFSAEWTSSYEERPESIKKLYVKVIDKVKAIPNDEKQEEVLTLINNFLNKVIDHPDVSDSYIKKFSEIFNQNQQKA
jgi:hypothetical protein